ncbi:MAG: DEAD/DEAH box helicase, partial [Proteobacteria bacterium]|nr:DEAD/DEAH box helicase [Pseudomonadota bacterium]
MQAVTFENDSANNGATDNTTGTLPTPEAETTSETASEYVANVSFESLGLSQETLQALAERGYHQPTPVQAQAFQPAFQGKDLIVRSKTGTGKTAAFGLPLLERIPKGTRETEALILCPTRELASQVATELCELAKYRDIQVAAIYGGAAMKPQEVALETGAAIVVGTPGRILDHMRRGNLKLRSCRHIVLDEADEMLNQGFYEEVTSIVEALPPERQVLLFSATVSDDIRRLIMRYTHEPQTLLLSKDVFTVEHIHHVRYDVDDAFPKPRNLLYVLEMEQPENAIVFCNTRDDTELVVAVLNRNGLDAELLNGDLPQKERERVMAKVKNGELAFMVATDLAARGIDISDLGHVINYSLPEDPAVYLHRVGRTGRIGKKGTALNLVSGRELSSYSALEKKYGIQFEKRQMPSPQVALEMWTERHVREIKEAASTTVFEGFLGLASQLKQRADAEELVAFLMRYFFWHQRKTKAQKIHEEQQTPSPSPKRSPSHSQNGKDKKIPPNNRSRNERRPPREIRETR